MTMNAQRKPFRDYAATHFRWQADADGKVATITLDRPEKKNPLTFESYAELRDLFRGLAHASDVKAIVIAGAGGNFSSGGDVHEIIGPLTRMGMPDLLAFTRMTGDLVKAMRHCPQPIVAAVDGICAGAGSDGRAGLRPPPRDAAGEDGVPVHAGRPRRLRHGGLHAAAADHRAGARRRAPLHRPRDDRGRRRGVGFLQPDRCAGGHPRARRRRWRARSPTARRSPTP